MKFGTLSKSRARHAEGALSAHGVEIRLTCEIGPIELDNPLEGCEAEIRAPWPEPGLIKKRVFGEGLHAAENEALEPAPEGGAVEPGDAGEGGAVEQASPVKVALPNQASPVKVALSNQASPVKVALSNRASPVKVALSNRASPVKVALSNEASP